MNEVARNVMVIQIFHVFEVMKKMSSP